jgi:ArsR family transcriptional regulator
MENVTKICLTPTESTDISAIAALCKAAGDPLRMQILKVLQQNAYGVLELCEIFNIQQAAMSHHLKVLANASLVAKRREGTSIFYRRSDLNSDIRLQALQTSLFNTIDKAQLEEIYTDRLHAINQARCQASVAFFNENVHRFEENQDLIASWSDYGESIEDFLSKHVVGRKPALEVGPGYGHFLTSLSHQFQHVVAVDNAQEMLDQCTLRASSQGLRNIEFIFGNTRCSALRNQLFDFISLNMVLHHNPNPASIFYDCAQLLQPHGSLVVTDLCAHDQEWTKKSCGDLWLGFEPESLSRWAEASGLIQGKSLYLTQRNGFRIQLRQFKPMQN